MADEPTGVLFVVDSLVAGGMERQIVELLRGLRRSGRYRVTLAVLERGGALEAEAAALAESVLPIRRRARFDVWPAVALVQHGRRAHIQLIHAFGWMSGLAGLVAARWQRVPIINGSIRAAPPGLGFRERISKCSAQLSDAIVANSRAGLRSYGLADHPRTAVIWNGVSLERFDRVTAERDTVPTICMVANFSKYKDQPAAIRAMVPIRSQFPAARLVLVGRDTGTLQESERLVAALGLTDAVRFVTTTQPESLIAGSDVCVLASNIRTHGEGISNAILEYMALGKPVVATDAGGNAEVIQDGVTGFLVPGDSADAIAERVIELLRAPARAQQMGEAGRQRVRDAFSMPRMVAEYEGLYARVLATPRPFA